MRNKIVYVTFSISFICSVFTSCNTSNENTNKTVENKKIEINHPEISDTVVAKSIDVKTNQVKQNSIEGTYVNSRNTIVKISKASEKGFTFECEMKSECGGMETKKGFATYVDANKAVTNISSEYEGDVFYIEKGVLTSFEPNGAYIGTDCQRSFDTEFSKK
jgi:hypothetical protein